VRDDQSSAVTHQPLQCLLHEQFAFRIQRRCRLVKKQDWRIAQDGARYRDALALSA
jgi:hypothetical protein